LYAPSGVACRATSPRPTPSRGTPHHPVTGFCPRLVKPLRNEVQAIRLGEQLLGGEVCAPRGAIADHSRTTPVRDALTAATTPALAARCGLSHRPRGQYTLEGLRTALPPARGSSRWSAPAVVDTEPRGNLVGGLEGRRPRPGPGPGPGPGRRIGLPVPSGSRSTSFPVRPCQAACQDAAHSNSVGGGLGVVALLHAVATTAPGSWPAVRLHPQQHQPVGRSAPESVRWTACAPGQDPGHRTAVHNSASPMMFDENAAQGRRPRRGRRPPHRNGQSTATTLTDLGLDASPGGHVNQGLPSSLAWQSGAREVSTGSDRRDGAAAGVLHS
jgi:hypothetical protein